MITKRKRKLTVSNLGYRLSGLSVIWFADNPLLIFYNRSCIRGKAYTVSYLEAIRIMSTLHLTLSHQRIETCVKEPQVLSQYFKIN